MNLTINSKNTDRKNVFYEYIYDDNTVLELKGRLHIKSISLHGSTISMTINYMKSDSALIEKMKKVHDYIESVNKKSGFIKWSNTYEVKNNKLITDITLKDYAVDVSMIIGVTVDRRLSRIMLRSFSIPQIPCNSDVHFIINKNVVSEAEKYHDSNIPKYHYKKLTVVDNVMKIINKKRSELHST
jgi:hypothetical protein